MTEMTGGHAAVEALRAERVGHVFGLIGSATMEMFDALHGADDISFVGVRDERTGTHMADGYARVSGGAGVVLAGQNGPGSTNLVTGLAQAKAAYSPVVAIAGHLATGHGADRPRRCWLATPSWPRFRGSSRSAARISTSTSPPSGDRSCSPRATARS